MDSFLTPPVVSILILFVALLVGAAIEFIEHEVNDFDRHKK